MHAAPCGAAAQRANEGQGDRGTREKVICSRAKRANRVHKREAAAAAARPQGELHSAQAWSRAHTGCAAQPPAPAQASSRRRVPPRRGTTPPHAAGGARPCACFTGTRLMIRQRSGGSIRQRLWPPPGSGPRRRGAARCAPQPCTCLQGGGGRTQAGVGGRLGRPLEAERWLWGTGTCTACASVGRAGAAGRMLGRRRRAEPAQPHTARACLTTDRVSQALDQLSHQGFVSLLQRRGLRGRAAGREGSTAQRR